jgi:preprotein translocase subunit SecF
MTRSDHIASSGLGRLFRGQTAIDFYGHRRIGLIVAMVVLLVTAGSLLTRGLNLGLDFEGGVAWDVPAGEQFDVDEAEQVLSDEGVSVAGAKIQRRSSETNDFITVQIEELPQEQIVVLTANFAAAADVTLDEVNFSFTSSTWGGEITNAAVRALVIFLILVAIFISIRFEWRMAVAALAALAQDVVVTVGI